MQRRFMQICFKAGHDAIVISPIRYIGGAPVIKNSEQTIEIWNTQMC